MENSWLAPDFEYERQLRRELDRRVRAQLEHDRLFVARFWSMIVSAIIVVTMF